MSTDKAWQQWGEQDPYFGVLTNERFRRRNLTAEDKAAFFESGRQHVEHVLAVLRRHVDPAFAPRRVLDFGCGVGRLVVPFAQVAGHVTGVDVSQGMLAEARRNCDAHGLANVTLALSDDALSAVEGSFDLVHSFIVFQHIEPQRGRELFRQLLSRIAPGGGAAVQFTYAKKVHAGSFGQQPSGAVHRLKQSIGSVKRRFLRRADPEMQMNVYPLNELLFMVQSLGVRDVLAEFTDHGGELGVCLYFRRP